MSPERRAQGYFLAGGVLLLLVFLTAFVGLTIHQEKLIHNELHTSATRLFDSIVVTWHWNSDYGGLYALKGPGVESSPYLDDPDVVAADGRVYTLKNPALMTREISERARNGSLFSFRITSLKPINPNNAPDAWERKALLSFHKGVREVHEVERVGETETYRLMRPLKFQKSCLECHEGEGYKVGDVRGGISVSLPFDFTAAKLKANRLAMAALALAVAILLGFVLYFFVWRLMNELQSRNRELHSMNEQRNKFLGIAAHDLRNPLAIIKGYLFLLRGGILGPINEQQHHVIGRMEKNSQSMFSLVEDLLDVSTIEAGKLDLQRRPVDLKEFLEEVRAQSEILARGKQIGVRLRIETDLPPVELDPDRIAQVLNNLVTNALKYSFPDTEIEIAARADDGWVVVSVSDQGQGIPTEEIPDLFGDFVRTSVRPTGGEKSTGLGLAIVKRIVEAHGGKVWAESNHQKGSTFYFTLPFRA